jgi:hypothetical protein
MKCPSNPE